MTSLPMSEPMTILNIITSVILAPKERLTLLDLRTQTSGSMWNCQPIIINILEENSILSGIFIKKIFLKFSH